MILYKPKKTKINRPSITKRNYNSAGRYCKFLNQSNDPNDWGHRKRHIHDWSEMEEYIAELNENGYTKHQLKSLIKYSYTYVKGKPFGTGKNRVIINSIDDIKELDRKKPEYSYYVEQWNTTGKITIHKTRYLCMERHLLAAQKGNKQDYLFYTTSPTKDYNIICLDIDDIESDEAYDAVVTYLLSLFPDCYYERSTSGTGLHFYIIVSFPPGRYFFSQVNEAVYRNLLYYLLSEALCSIVNDNFAVKFDAVKGTNPIYDEHNNFLKYGTLVKLPTPVTYNQFNTLYSAPVYSEDIILCMINYFNDMSCRYYSGFYSVCSLMDSLEVILKDIPVRTSPKDILAEIKKLDNTTTTFLPTTTITNGGTNSLPVIKIGNISQNKSNNKYDNMDIMNIGDSRIRESLYIKRYVGEYYSQYGTKPSEEEVKRNYRIEMNYHKIGDYRENRFKKYYDHTIQTFDPDKASDGDCPYKIGMYDSVINHTNQQLTELGKNETSYIRNIYRYDVDITLEYIYICSKNKKNKAREKLIIKLAKQEGSPETEVENRLKYTASRKGLKGFYKFVQEKYKTVVINGQMKKVNGCDPKKASAMLDLVVKLKLAECIDGKSEHGIARKFQLSEAVRQVRESWNAKNSDKDKKVG